MVSRKKAKGKARRAVKETKEAEEGRYGDKAAAVANQDGSLEAQMQRLTIDDLLIKCRHGFEVQVESEKLCIMDFMMTFDDEYRARARSGESDMVCCFKAGMASTWDRSDVWKNPAMLRKIISCNVAFGTDQLLLENDNAADEVAHSASYYAYFFEQYVEVHFEKSRPTMNWQQILELHYADEHTLVSFFRKRIPCKCLDKKYKAVKSVIKMGVCANPSCSLPDRNAPRASMFSCAECHSTCYCSTECQKAHWPFHKGPCKHICRRSSQLYSKGKVK